MGLTYYARGRNLIVNAGHDGYANTPYRAYLSQSGGSAPVWACHTAAKWSGSAR